MTAQAWAYELAAVAVSTSHEVCMVCYIRVVQVVDKRMTASLLLMMTNADGEESASGCVAAQPACRTQNDDKGARTVFQHACMV